MIITRKHLPRRTFLRGAGAALALPFLDAMTPAMSRNIDIPLRLAFVYVPNGIVMDEWKPKEAGNQFKFTRILKPLESLREDISILTGFEDHNGNALGDGAGDHARAGASYLSGVHCHKTAGSDIQAGISADQIAAAAIGSRTRFASLELGCEDSRTVGNCDSGYSCAYTNSISWRTPTTPMPPEVNPRMAFERLFGNEDLSIDPETRARRLENRKSILDMIRDDTQRLVSSLGANDKHKIDEYLYSVREIERRIESAEKSMSVRGSVKGIDKPNGIPVSFIDYAKIMFDIMWITFQADLSRIATLVVGREGSNRVYPEIDITDPHHPLTHHRNIADWIEKVVRINILHAELFAEFLKKLKSTSEGDGTLLDRSMIVYGSGLGDGNSHSHYDLPTLLAGRGSGSIKTGRHIVFDKRVPITNLYMTLLDAMGVRPDSIGDSTGKIEVLT